MISNHRLRQYSMQNLTLTQILTNKIKTYFKNEKCSCQYLQMLTAAETEITFEQKKFNVCRKSNYRITGGMTFNVTVLIKLDKTVRIQCAYLHHGKVQTVAS